MLGTDRISERIGCSSLSARERERAMVDQTGAWFEERFFDPDHPVDGDWLLDAEAGRLMVEGNDRNKMGTKSIDVNTVILDEAERYMNARGLAPHYRPRLEIHDSRVYAFKPDGDAIRLDYSLYWEKETGFADMISALVEDMISERPLFPWFQPSYASWD